MISDEECTNIFDQLAQMVVADGRKDVVDAVTAQIRDIDSVPSTRLREAEAHFEPQALLTPTNANTQTLYQTPFPFIAHQPAEFLPSSAGRPDDNALLAYIYPPYERLKLLLRAIEAAYSEPIIMALSALDLLGQDEIMLETPNTEESFTLSRNALSEQEPHAQVLLHHIEQLRYYISQEGEHS